MAQANSALPAEYSDEVIPVLDFRPYLAGEDGALDRLADELRHAQENIGFYFAVNHGVPRDLVDRSHGNIRRFFDLPDAEKRKHKNYLPTKSTIYVSSTVNENTQPDLNEMLRMVRERPADHPAIKAGFSAHGPNHWPDESLLPGWKAEMLEYYDAMEALGFSLLPVYARALDLPLRLPLQFREERLDAEHGGAPLAAANQHVAAAARHAADRAAVRELEAPGAAA